jgi:hypothetical protein
MRKNMTTNKVFGEVAKELNFYGSGLTRYIVFSSYYLLINHQKSSYSKCFYVNIGLIYKDILDNSLSDYEILGAYKVKEPTAPIHVDFRIECFPLAPSGLQEKLDYLTRSGKMDELKSLLLKVFRKLIIFVEENYDRKNIRKLQDERKLSAMVMKEA